MEITKEDLQKLYVEQGLSVRDCARVLGLPTHGGISWRLKKFGIKTRPAKFQKGNRYPGDRKPEQHGSWKGGKQTIYCTQCGAEWKRFPSHVHEINFCNMSCRDQWKARDLQGQKFGLLTVINKAGKDKNNHILWECKCDCGGVKLVTSSDLTKNVISCGCMNHKKGALNPQWKGGKIEVPCANPECNNSKMIYPQRQKTYSNIYCSSKCRAVHNATTVRGENHPSYKEKIKVVCAYCGTPLKILPSSASSYKNHFCKGTDCISKWRSENLGTESNPNWKGGLSFEPYPVTWTVKLQEAIRNRDGRVCQVCGKSETDNGARLAVHHIDYVKHHVNPDNLVSLCHLCHVKTNSKREQWIKLFLNR